MAAVSASKKPDLQLLVFVAIMLHKFPASFGLVSFLLNEKTERQRIRKHLMAFSLAAPIGALLTYMFMAIVTVVSEGVSALFHYSPRALIYEQKYSPVTVVFIRLGSRSFSRGGGGGSDFQKNVENFVYFF